MQLQLIEEDCWKQNCRSYAGVGNRGRQGKREVYSGCSSSKKKKIVGKRIVNPMQLQLIDEDGWKQNCRPHAVVVNRRRWLELIEEDG